MYFLYLITIHKTINPNFKTEIIKYITKNYSRNFDGYIKPSNVFVIGLDLICRWESNGGMVTNRFTFPSLHVVRGFLGFIFNVRFLHGGFWVFFFFLIYWTFFPLYERLQGYNVHLFYGPKWHWRSSWWSPVGLLWFHHGLLKTC